MIFFAYFSAYTNKPTRFSLFMSSSFFLLSAGYLMILTQYFAPNFSQYLFNDLGDITGVIGLVALVAAVSWE